ncbi:MAG TPA: formate--phosphoribosylaminoimidazolecarboxamide ligase [Thermoplasmatales archaeon]|nr:MAG: formate--phosphoribosylaminoimidazolecarboxamide ligase [Thermoplasmata archaeon]RLF33587.1 MAG: 5-formaminoimidazole-4-carboxamide-1-(beta)-D-ribofuranosyl 5'-monophosphate synthetase [Thermoplasmata archaeon]HDN50665.1 formate--phosphoribosylaminoimidazolecarboxamide ligase [Thermoplasmatales archaeon]
MGIEEILSRYDRNSITIATACSHSSLQIFNGIRKEGFKSIGIAIGTQPAFYDAFPLGRPDEFLIVDSYKKINEYAAFFYKKNAIVVPHGSFVEYMGADNFLKLQIPTFGNKAVLEWESNREKERQWLEGAGLIMPEIIDDSKEIHRPVIVKYYGAKGGKGFFVAKDYEEFRKRIDKTKPYIIQEFLIGTRYYIHYFYSPLKKDGYRVRDGSLEVLSIDRRDEANIDEAHRLGSISELEEMGIRPSFVVTGNIPIVMRESLLPKVFEMGKRVVEKSYELFGGIVGPFCLETVVTDQLEIKVFEISARIVAGTNLYISGSPYADLIQPGLSTGQRIAQEIKMAIAEDKLEEIVT